MIGFESFELNANPTKKLPVEPLTLCARCKHRDSCKDRSSHVKVCWSEGHGIKFHEDRQETAIIKKRRQMQLEEFMATFKHVDISQIELFRNSRFRFLAKPASVRKELSRNGSAKRTADGLLKHCENCGAEFETVTKTRRICDDCWDEICGRLGVCYAAISPFHYQAAKKQEEAMKKGETNE